ncbi:MAG: hypothetical protein JSV54_06595 [Chloroflexota bacterium]|nr:MAG: hypothetical protein JSV54_06595 [Chloroflexota bacterium]
MRIRNLVADIILISLSASLLWHMSNIWRYEEHFIREPILSIRILETVWFALVLSFGVVKCISDLKDARR